jgi:hypothetical protein
VITEYQKFLAAVNKKTTDINSSIVNSKAMAPWLTTLLVGGYIIFGGSHVVSGSLPQATLLSTNTMFRAVGGEFEKVTTLFLILFPVATFNKRLHAVFFHHRATPSPWRSRAPMPPSPSSLFS